MIKEISETNFIVFEQFWAMWLMWLKSDLNIIAEFMKFNTHRFKRGIVTSDCIESVLWSEGVQEQIIHEKVLNFEHLF